MSGASLDQRIRAAVYDGLLHTGRGPSVPELAASLGVGETDVREGLGRLAAAHVIVLRPGSDELWMAMPFSAVPTDFHVEAERPAGVGGGWWANCAWDALGIPAMLRGAGLPVGASPVRIRSRCPDCSESLTLVVRPDAGGGEAVRYLDTDGVERGRAAADSTRALEPVVHFAVPARRWWDDIGFT